MLNLRSFIPRAQGARSLLLLSRQGTTVIEGSLRLNGSRGARLFLPVTVNVGGRYVYF
jgi:hypothetical protein